MVALDPIHSGNFGNATRFCRPTDIYLAELDQLTRGGRDYTTERFPGNPKYLFRRWLYFLPR